MKGLCVCAVLLLGSSLVMAGPGDLDAEFGVDGVSRFDFGMGYGVTGRSVLQPDGKVIVVGGTGEMYLDAIIARLNVDGSLDNSFSEDGRIRISFEDAVFADAVVHPDGRISAVGYARLEGTLEFKALILRLNSDGSVDESFGDSGLMMDDFSSGTNANAISVALQQDGKMLLAGMVSEADDVLVVVRYNDDGSPDVGFAETRFALETDVHAYVSDIALLPDGRVLVTGKADGSDTGVDTLLVMINENGGLDSSFGTSGIRRIAAGADYQSGRAVVTDSENRIYVGGHKDDNAVIWRFTPGGNNDLGFGTEGERVLPTAMTEILALAIQPDGRLLMTATDDSWPHRMAIARMDQNGSMDATFGIDGIKILELSANSVEGTGLGLDLHGGIIAYAGTKNDENFFEMLVVRLLANDVDDDGQAESWLFSPSSMAFSPVLTAEPESLQVSEIQLVSGVGEGLLVPLRVEDGEYALNGSASYSDRPVWVVNGAQVNVRHLAAATVHNTMSTVLQLGGIMDKNNHAMLRGGTSVSFSSLVNQAPVFGQATYEFSVTEGADVGSVVGVIAATDNDDLSLSYSIVGGNDAAVFDIDGEGTLRLNAGLGVVGTVYSLSVSASDPHLASTVVTVNISVVAVEDVQDTTVDDSIPDDDTTNDGADDGSNDEASVPVTASGGGGGGAIGLWLLLALLLSQKPYLRHVFRAYR